MSGARSGTWLAGHPLAELQDPLLQLAGPGRDATAVPGPAAPPGGSCRALLPPHQDPRAPTQRVGLRLEAAHEQSLGGQGSSFRSRLTPRASTGSLNWKGGQARSPANNQPLAKPTPATARPWGTEMMPPPNTHTSFTALGPHCDSFWVASARLWRPWKALWSPRGAALWNT